MCYVNELFNAIKDELLFGLFMTSVYIQTLVRHR